jgi:predicted TIM-barrel enzyme
MRLLSNKLPGEIPRRTAVRFIKANSSYYERTASLPPSTSHSMCCWYNIRTALANSQFVISAGDTTGKVIGLGCDLGGGFGLGLFSYDGAVHNVAFTRQPAVNETNFIAYTVNGTGAGAQVGYHGRIGGVLESINQTGITQTINAIRAGVSVFDGTDFWDGDVWDWAIWNRPLSPGEIRLIHRFGPAAVPIGLIGFYPLGNTKNIFDLSPTRQKLTAAGGTIGVEGVYYNQHAVRSPLQIVIPFSVAAAAGSTGTLAYTNNNDTLAGSGTSTVNGTLAYNNNNDTLAAAGKSTVIGTLGYTNNNDTLAASGTAGAGNNGTLAYTNNNDTLAGTGAPVVKGTLAATNANDTLAAAGTSTVKGSLAYTNNNDTLAASGKSTVIGTLAASNNNDTLSASGNSGVPPVVTDYWRWIASIQRRIGI